MSACEKDNRSVFRADETFETNDGGTKCNTSDPTITTKGTWKFTTSETMLTETKNGKTIDATLDALDANTMAISYKQTISGYFFNVKETYGHQCDLCCSSPPRQYMPLISWAAFLYLKKIE